ncbi:MAG: hypothetical protein H7A38_01625 [Chlamydiales bacterium]|nr:hypothetical protein [Chlamydiales bacterium]
MDEEIDLPKPVMVNWKKIGLYVIPAALVIGVLVSRLGTKKTQSEKDFVAATAAFTKWNHILNHESLELAQLEKMIKKHPELQARFDGAIGQSLLAAIAPKEATPFIVRSLGRTKKAYYGEYSKTSLKVSQGHYKEALEEALHLKEKMASDSDYWNKLGNSSALFAFNQMRIATLSQQLGEKEQELSAWKEIKSHIQSSGKNSPGHEGFKQLFSHFTVQEATLLDYIKTREEDLSQP